LIRSAALMGKSKNINNLETDENMSDSLQKNILEKFRKLEYNLLVVTSVAAEGVDIPGDIRFFLIL
jgi:ERCC4-related helicase